MLPKEVVSLPLLEAFMARLGGTLGSLWVKKRKKAHGRGALRSLQT